MSTYLLIHGAWHGGWCWRDVTPLLERAGYTVITPDLPGSGHDLTPLAAVTFASYVQCVVDIIDALPTKEPLIVVGHSTSGMIISQVAEARPERLGGLGLLVYLSALLPTSGETALQIIERDANPTLAACLVVDDVSVCMLPKLARDVLYQDGAWKEIRDALRLLTPQASLPLITPVTLTTRFLSVPRVYLTCRYDRVLSPSLQSQMYAITPCERVLWLMTGHAPFLSAPDRLAARLIGLDRLVQTKEHRSS